MYLQKGCAWFRLLTKSSNAEMREIMLKEMLEFNKKFVENKEYWQFQTDKYPKKKTAILSCMDTRLTHLLPAALGLENGDVKVIKNAGAQVSSNYGSVIKSLVIAIFELGVQEIIVIGHDDCGVQRLEGRKIIEKMIERGIEEKEIKRIQKSECDLEKWLSGFGDIDYAVAATVMQIKQHPLIPEDIPVVGLIMDPVTGEVREANHPILYKNAVEEIAVS